MGYFFPWSQLPDATSFVQTDLRTAAMKLHTRDQSREGEQEAQKPISQWTFPQALSDNTLPLCLLWQVCQISDHLAWGLVIPPAETLGVQQKMRALILVRFALFFSPTPERFYTPLFDPGLMATLGCATRCKMQHSSPKF